MDYKKIQLAFFLGILLITLAGTIAIFQPYFNAVILALALGVVFRPVYNWFLKGMKKYPPLASLITVLLVMLIILLPLVIVGIVMAREATQVYNYLTSAGTSHLLLEEMQATINSIIPGAPIDVAQYANDFATESLNYVVQNIGSFFSSVVEVVISAFIVLFGLYYIFKDGRKFKKSLITYSPLADKYDKQIYNKLITAVNSVVKGELFIALLQGVLAGLGFWIFGVPNPVLLGAFTVLGALIPGVGVLITFIPTVIYLFFASSGIGWIGLALWGLFLVGMIDNFLRPKLIERGINIHPLLIFLSVLGGITLLGPFGFLIGPMLLSLLFALLDIYKAEFKDYLK